VAQGAPPGKIKKEIIIIGEKYSKWGPLEI